MHHAFVIRTLVVACLSGLPLVGQAHLPQGLGGPATAEVSERLFVQVYDLQTSQPIDNTDVQLSGTGEHAVTDSHGNAQFWIGGLGQRGPVRVFVPETATHGPGATEVTFETHHPTAVVYVAPYSAYLKTPLIYDATGTGGAPILLQTRVAGALWDYNVNIEVTAPPHMTQSGTDASIWIYPRPVWASINNGVPASEFAAQFHIELRAPGGARLGGQLNNPISVTLTPWGPNQATKLEAANHGQSQREVVRFNYQTHVWDVQSNTAAVLADGTMRFSLNRFSTVGVTIDANAQNPQGPQTGTAPPPVYEFQPLACAVVNCAGQSASGWEWASDGSNDVTMDYQFKNSVEAELSASTGAITKYIADIEGKVGADFTWDRQNGVKAHTHRSTKSFMAANTLIFGQCYTGQVCLTRVDEVIRVTMPDNTIGIVHVMRGVTQEYNLHYNPACPGCQPTPNNVPLSQVSVDPRR